LQLAFSAIIALPNGIAELEILMSNWELLPDYLNKTILSVYISLARLAVESNAAMSGLE
jgi:hypothetical protein